MPTPPTATPRARRAGSLVIALLLAAALPGAAAPVAAQRPSQGAASCVGGPLGCQQADVAITLAPGPALALDRVRLTTTTGGWLFSAAQPGTAEDAFGPNFFAPTVADAGQTLVADFAPGFQAVLDPTATLRTQFDHAPDAFPDASSLGFTYVGSVGGRATIAGEGGAARRSRLTAACVGGALGCEQVDFTFTLLGAARAATLDFFRLWLPTGSGWTFAAAQPGTARDALGPNLFTPLVTDAGLTLAGAFAPDFEALVDPTLVVRAQFEPNAFVDAASLAAVYELGVGDVTQFAGLVVQPIVIPEPTTLGTVAAGLLALAGVARARRRGRVRADG